MTENGAAEQSPAVSNKPASNILKLQSRYKDAPGNGGRFVTINIFACFC